MNQLISFGIPTFNRSELLDEALSHYFQVLHLQEYVLYISDNASDDNTEDVVKKWKKEYKNIVYYKQKENIGADRNMCFLQNQCKSDYFMLLGDGVRINQGVLDDILELLRLHSYDMVCFDYNQRSEGKIPPQVYTDRNKLLREIGWYLTQMSSYILSKKIIDETRQNLHFYKGSEFNYYKRMFDYASKNQFRYYWMESDAISFSEIPKRNGWKMRKSRVWYTEYTNTVMSMPENYSLQSKKKCLKEASGYHLFSLYTIMADITGGCLTKKSFRENVTGMKLLLGIKKTFIAGLLVRCPKSFVRLLKAVWEEISRRKRIYGSLQHFHL